MKNRNDEKQIKFRNKSNLQLRPGFLKKGIKMDFMRPYQEPGKVPLAEKAKASWENQIKGIRQNSPVSSV